MKAELNIDFIAINAGEVTIYNYDSETREFLSSTVEFLPVGVGIPANSCTDEPPVIETGFVCCRKIRLLEWECLPDHRGEIVYSTETGELVEITLPGEYPNNTTLLQPTTRFDNWDGTQWVTDTDLVHAVAVANAEAEKIKLLSAAKQTISIWQTQLQLGMITDANKERLILWVIYIEAVQAVDTNTAQNISWPTQPEA